MSILQCIVITLTVIGVDLITIDRVVMIITVGVLGRVNPITAIIEQIHQYQSIGLNGDVKLILQTAVAKYLNAQYVNQLITGLENALIEQRMIQRKNKLTLSNDELYNCYINKFVGKTLNHAVLDSRCTKTVCGLSWLDNLETLSPEDKEKVVEKRSETKFRFGDGETVGSLKSVIIPVQIGNSEIMIQTDVISNELPLLLSTDAMKKANTKN